MKILYITNSPIEYSSSANIRNTSLIKGLKLNGHDVDILTCYPDKNSKYYDSTITKHLDASIKYIDREEDTNEQELENIKYRSSNLYHKIRNNLYKLYNALSIYDPRKRNLKFMDKIEINEPYDVVISSSDPKSSHLIAEKIVERLKVKKWIQYWGDPLSADINKKGIIPKSLLRNEELRLLKKADLSIYVSPITFEMQIRQFHQVAFKLRYLPIPIIIDKSLSDSSSRTNKLTIGYYGDYFSRDRNIFPLVEACKISEFNFEIYGNSDLIIETSPNISVNNRVSYDKIKELEKDVDVLVCLCNKVGGQIPGKIYHYASTNKPILLIIDGPYKELIKNKFGEYSNYFVCDNNVSSIKKAVETIKDNKRKIVPIDDFSYEKIAQEMIDFVTEIS